MKQHNKKNKNKSKKVKNFFKQYQGLIQVIGVTINTLINVVINF